MKRNRGQPLRTEKTKTRIGAVLTHRSFCFYQIFSLSYFLNCPPPWGPIARCLERGESSFISTHGLRERGEKERARERVDIGGTFLVNSVFNFPMDNMITYM